MDVVSGMGGIRVGDLGSRKCHQQEQERSHGLSRDLDGVKPEVFNKVVRSHGEVWF